MHDVAKPKPVIPGPRTIKLDWKLPARLRRPVYAKPAWPAGRATAGKPVRFKRRALRTSLHSLPNSERSRVLAPPHVGRFLGETKQASSPPVQPTFAPPAGGPAYRTGRATAGRPAIKLPTSRLQLPVRFDVIPHGTLPRKIPHLLILIVGCGVMAAILWNLQGAGRAVAVLGAVQERAKLAYEKLASARAALAETDFKKSEADFAASQVDLQQAWQQLDGALASSRRVLETLDVTGTVRTGSAALAAGEAVSAAGVHLSRAADMVLSGHDLVGAITAARPELEAARKKLEEAEQSMQDVTVSRLPQAAQADWEKLSMLVPRLRVGITKFMAGSDSLLVVLGAEHDRQYLLLFENNHELRPTGGFIGSIGLVNIKRGVVENVAVNSVYDPDGQLLKAIAPPEPLRRIVDRWFLRDANWFVDYRSSARTIADFLEKEKGPTVDGVIALTPEVIKSLLKITGPIALPRYNVTVDSENFVPLTQEEVTYTYDRTINKPKQFLHDLAPLLMNRLMQASREHVGEVLAALMGTLREKQLLLYFRDEAVQQRIEAIGWAGAIEQRAPGFLSVNTANIGGHKSDQFIEQEIDYRLEVKADRSVEAVVTIRRTHHGPTEALDREYPPDENPAFRDNIVWQRVLVPLGAELLEANGFSAEPKREPSLTARSADQLEANPLLAEWQRAQRLSASGTIVGQEAGLTYFANWQITKPGQTTIGLYRYRLPSVERLPGGLNLFESYALQLVKQPGDLRTTVRAELVLPPNMRMVTVQPEDGITREADRQLVYRGALTRDTVIGATYEHQ